MYFVLCILEDASPGRLIGPFDDNDSAVAKLIELATKERGVLDDDTKDMIEMDGYLGNKNDHGGMYVVMSE